MNRFLDFVAGNWREMLWLAGEHLLLVCASIAAAAAVGLPLGVILTRRPALKRPVLGLANVLQTVPSIALFGLLIPLPWIGGIGARTAIIALVLYALLPIIRNTMTGIEGVDRHVREAAVAMGMTDGQVLRQVELPLALEVIFSGVRVAAVISVGVATIAAAIGAGGLGTYIFRGLRMYDNVLIVVGALPAALMALAADFGFGALAASLDSRRRGKRRAADEDAPRTFTAKRATIAAIVVVAIAAVGLGGWYFLSARSASEDGGNNAGKPRVAIGSKDFTEQVILGEMLAQTAEAAGFEVERQFELGGNLCHDALLAGDIDAYPEYTGTAYTAILQHSPISDADEVYEQVTREYAEKFRVEVGAPLGFSNDFAILVRGGDARRLNLKTISDAVPHAAGWRAGFGQDFMSRADGYAGFARAYQIDFRRPPREMDLSLTYRALADGEVDLIAGNSTDGLIAALDLFQLTDDRRYFPPYQAVVLARGDALARHENLRAWFDQLSGKLTTEEMRRLNYEVDGRRREVREVVREFLRGKS